MLLHAVDSAVFTPFMAVVVAVEMLFQLSVKLVFTPSSAVVMQVVMEDASV